MESFISKQTHEEVEPADWNFEAFCDKFAARGSPSEIPEEIRLYDGHHRFMVEQEQREETHKEEMRLMEERFRAADKKRREDRVAALGWQLLQRGIQETRRLIVPAYTFDRFQQLPTELRLRVWSCASRCEDPQIHRFKSKAETTSVMFYEKEPVPSVLHACRESREEALKVFTLLPTPPGILGRRQSLYFNTLYDSFYLGHTESWKNFKILIDILVKHNTTRPLPASILPDMEKFKKIHHLVVDLRIFGALPPKTWTEFPNLDVLTVTFYPFDEEEEFEVEFFQEKSCPRRPGFVTAHPRNWYGLHAKRLSEHIIACIKRAKDEVPEWRKPMVEVKQRRVGSYNDYYSEQDRKHQESEEEEYQWFDESDDDDTDEVEAAGDEEVIFADKGEKDLKDHDLTLKPQMPFEVPMKEIRHFKHKFHPPRMFLGHGRRRKGTEKGKEKEFGSYFTDSETEHGGTSTYAADDDDPYLW